jgi:hypothetical protein
MSQVFEDPFSNITVTSNGMGTITADSNGKRQTFLIGPFGHIWVKVGNTNRQLEQVPGFGSSWNNLFFRNGVIGFSKTRYVVCLHDVFSENPRVTIMDVGRNFRRNSGEGGFYIGRVGFTIPNTMFVVDLDGTTRTFRFNDTFDKVHLLNEERFAPCLPTFLSN